MACQRNAIEMAFRWRANDGPLTVVIGSSPHQLKQKVKVGPPLTKFSGSAHEQDVEFEISSGHSVLIMLNMVCLY